MKCPENERDRLSGFNNPEASVSVSLSEANSGFTIRLAVNETTYLVLVHRGRKQPDVEKKHGSNQDDSVWNFFISSKPSICLKLI